MSTSTLLLFALAATSPGPAAPTTLPGAVLEVGPGQVFATIQDAVDSAVSGDLVLVYPGTYNEFVVDGKGISVLAESTPFIVLEPSNAPAILVQNIAAFEQVTIIGARVDHGASTNTPAVHVRNSPGAVRFIELTVNLVQDLGATDAHAAMQVEHTGTFWLKDSRIWTGTPRLASRNGGTEYDEGVSGLEVVESDGIVQSVLLRGYDALAAYAGDGLRVIGNASVWMVDDYVQSPTHSILRGGDGDVAGSALHYFGPRNKQGRMTSCGFVDLIPGNGTVEDGGAYAINGDGGLASGGLFPTFRLPRACSNVQFSETSVGSPTTSVGGQINVRVWSVEVRQFITVMTLGTEYRRNFFRRDGRGMLQLGSPVLMTVGTGTTPGASGRANFPVAVPNILDLIGVQLTFQSLIGPPGSPYYDVLSFPDAVLITP